MQTDDDLLVPWDSHTTGARQPHRRRAFSDHLVAYLAVNATLWISWLVVAPATGAWFPWPLVPTVGWGIGLAIHAWWASGPRGRPVDAALVPSRRDRPAQP
ncbi:hypothetical protein GCM10027451_51710 [Geodermatophilus aquaeductus]|uniref:2TM domain-containing protein n=1 Tax=Geodermatophilus aquaeductus TaxID=1564161 RepID=A0A521FW34_9ACTN|nr:2TM domain-containing protein [Geodermatophilus aquaeductus]SMP00031.1 2TM domain-containing protein [Geodermatophilus aquaeductus]